MVNNAKDPLIKKIGNVLLNVILVCSIIMIVFTILLRVAGNNPSFGGFMLLRVSSASMEPELEVGDVILTESVSDVSALKVGDIITYEGEVGGYADKLITHEIVTAPYKSDGVYCLVTKGTANSVSDPVITEEQIVGKMVVNLPFFGEIYNFFITPWGLAVSIFLIIIVFAGEFWHIRNMPQLDEIDEEEEESEYAPKHSKQ